MSSNVHFVVYRKTDGEILRQGSCPKGEHSIQARAGEAVLVTEHQVDDSKMIVDITLKSLVPAQHFVIHDVAGRILRRGICQRGHSSRHAKSGERVAHIDPHERISTDLHRIDTSTGKAFLPDTQQ